MLPHKLPDHRDELSNSRRKVEGGENLHRVESPATKKAHASDWEHFTDWCSRQGFQPCPANPRAVAAYVNTLASSNYAISTITRRLATISVTHRRNKLDSPTRAEAVREEIRKAKRRYGETKARKVPITVADIKKIPAVLPEGIKGVRDLAMILLGYCGAFRRSELVAVDVADLEFIPHGIQVSIRRSVPGQNDKVRDIEISCAYNAELCPVNALKKWLDVADIKDGPVFRGVNRHGHISDRRLNDRAVAEVIKDIAEKIGLDPEEVGGHSLRAGFITDGLAAGLPTPIIRRFSGHKSAAMFSEYYSEDNLVTEGVTRKLGL